MMNRTNAWSRIGTNVGQEQMIENAIKRAQMDWEVVQKPITVDGKVYDKLVANTRSDNGEILGMVSNRYQVVQNTESFDMVNEMLKSGLISLEKMGELDGGRRTWLIAKMQDQKVVEDKVTPYLIFQNSHDGSTNLRVGIAPLRIVCQNQFNVAFKNTEQQWSIRHTSNAQNRLEEAKNTILLANDYMDTFTKDAEALVNKKVDQSQYWNIMKKLYPVNDEMSDLRKERIGEELKAIRKLYVHADDLQNYRGTAWGIFNAISDYVTHKEPRSKQDGWEERKFMKLMDNNEMLNKAHDILIAA